MRKEVVMPTTQIDRRTAAETRALVPDQGDAAAWEDARKRLETPEMYRTYWLTTLHDDGRPHAMPILGLWIDGVFYFLTSEDSRKGENLANDGRCVVSVSITSLPAIFALPVMQSTPSDEYRSIESLGAIVAIASRTRCITAGKSTLPPTSRSPYRWASLR